MKLAFVILVNVDEVGKCLEKVWIFILKGTLETCKFTRALRHPLKKRQNDSRHSSEVVNHRPTFEALSIIITSVDLFYHV